MIHNFNNFIFEYNNKNLHFKLIKLQEKQPNLINLKYDEQQSKDFLKLIECGMNKLKKMDCWLNFVNFINNNDFISDCAKVGINIEYILNHIHYLRNQYFLTWFLYDKVNNTIKLCPNKGDDYLGAKILGSGIQKTVYDTNNNDQVIKKKEDVSDVEIYLSNKYPNLFATYKQITNDLLKQEKLDIYTKHSNFDEEYELLNNTIENVVAKERNIISDYTTKIPRILDIHEYNVGYDKNGNLKCFDFMF